MIPRLKCRSKCTNPEFKSQPFPIVNELFEQVDELNHGFQSLFRLSGCRVATSQDRNSRRN